MMQVHVYMYVQFPLYREEEVKYGNKRQVMSNTHEECFHVIVTARHLVNGHRQGKIIQVDCIDDF